MELNDETLKKLQAQFFPVATFDKLFSIKKKGKNKDEKANSIKRVIDDYMLNFVMPNDEFRCICCGARLGGPSGSFVYGIASHEGYCGICQYPCRSYHNPKNENGENILKEGITMILQYHPSIVEMKGEDDG